MYVRIIPPVLAMQAASATPAAAGVGDYPTSVCFDPSRPSLLPYVMQDFQEMACNANLLFCGNTTCGNSNAASEQAASGATVIDPTTGQAVTSPGGVAITNPTAQSAPFGAGLSWIPWAIGGLVGLALFGGFLGGKR